MGSLFPPWSNTALYVALVVLGVFGVLLVASPMIYVRLPWRRGQMEAIDQPVEFDHRHHTQDDGMNCRYCHSTVTTTKTAGIPPTSLCMGCHSQIWNDSPLLEPVRRSYFSGTPIPYKRVYQLPDFTYFNHAIHVSKGVGCVTCHGRVDQMARVYQVPSLTMGWCLDCHRSPERFLRPLSAITDMTWAADDADPSLGAALRERLDVLPRIECSTCHR